MLLRQHQISFGSSVNWSWQSFMRLLPRWGLIPCCYPQCKALAFLAGSSQAWESKQCCAKCVGIAASVHSSDLSTSECKVLGRFARLYCMTSCEITKEKVYADRRVWEASDRPWRPFSASHGVGKQAGGGSMGVQMIACGCCVGYSCSASYFLIFFLV